MKDSNKMNPSPTIDPVKAYDDTVPIAVQAQESKRRKRRIMKIAVYFMFGIIAIGVFAIWLFHKDTVESLRYGSSFILTVKLRSLEVKNNDGDGVLYGDMGRYLLATPYDHCWDSNYEYYEEYCLYWRNMARLRVERDDNSTLSCYTLQWEGLKAGFLAEDCFYLQHYHWYGYLTNNTQSWPISDVYFQGVDYYPEYPNKQTENLVPVWFGSQGVTLFVDSSYPFTLAWNISDKRQFCLTSKLTAKEDNEPAPLLRYTICQAKTFKDVYSVSQQHRQDMETDFAFKQKHKHLLLSKPIHALISRENGSDLLKQMQSNRSMCSLLELYDNWEGEFGDLSVDASWKENVFELINEAARHQCHPILPISTFFSYNSKHFQEGVSNGYFVKDTLNLVTRMIQWRGKEGAVLDVTNPHAEEWFLDHIRRLIKQLDVKALKLLNLNIPPDSKYYDYNMTHLDYTRIFYRDMASLNISLILELATGFIPFPVYTPVRMKFYGKPGSSCLNTSIPYSLTLGMSGFPLLIAYADRMALASENADVKFMLWLQMAVFFPVLEIPSIPLLKNEKMQQFLKVILEVRQEKLLPYMTQVWEEQPDYPIIRPMWWVAPNDETAKTINDQFMVGDRLLVAPVLCEGTMKRFVYLPKGTWKTTGVKPVQGPQTVEVTTNVTIVPYFWKIDSETS